MVRTKLAAFLSGKERDDVFRTQQVHNRRCSDVKHLSIGHRQLRTAFNKDTSFRSGGGGGVLTFYTTTLPQTPTHPAHEMDRFSCLFVSANIANMIFIYLSLICKFQNGHAARFMVKEQSEICKLAMSRYNSASSWVNRSHLFCYCYNVSVDVDIHLSQVYKT